MVLKIMRYLFLIFFSVNLFWVYGQSNTLRGPDIEQTYIVINKIIFYPKDTLNIFVKNKNCENQTNTFFLNGLELFQDSLLKLKLTHKDVFGNESFYEIKYESNDSSQCIEHINYFIFVKIPIFLNGKELTMESMKLLGNIKPNEIKSIRKEHPFSKRKQRIVIITK